ncbi:hypothetical protein LCGC14_2497000, partial [marine sediment metagenome]
EEVYIEQLNSLRRSARKEYASVPIDHGDRQFLSKLIAWKIVEKSRVLSKEAEAALLRNRERHIEKGPQVEDEDEEGLSVSKRKRGRKMKTSEKKTTTVEDTESRDPKEDKKSKKSKGKKPKDKKSKKSKDKKTKSNLIFKSKVTGPVAPTDKFTFKGDVPEGIDGIVAKAFKGGALVSAAVTVMEEMKSKGKIKSPMPVNGLLRRSMKKLVRTKTLSRAK